MAKGKTGASVTERDRRTTRKETVLRDRLADAEKLVAKRAAQLLAATAERDEAAGRLAAVAGYTVEGYCLRERTRVTIRVVGGPYEYGVPGARHAILGPSQAEVGAPEPAVAGAAGSRSP